MNMTLYLVIILVTATFNSAQGQSTWDYSQYTCNPRTCQQGNATCECRLVVEHKLTMMIQRNSSTRGLLVIPKNGKLYDYQNQDVEKDQDAYKIITADAEGSRLVIALNGEFPGPTITAYEGQELRIEIINKMHTDSTTVHWHGIHQRGTAWSDGVAFTSQCPILPGQTYTYTFTANPHGTNLYHAHIGDQRSMGLYGALIIYPSSKKLSKMSQPQTTNQHIVTIQDWNHNDDPEALYQRMINGVFDFSERRQIQPTSSYDGSGFSRFHFHTGIINGKGRFYSNLNDHNGAPLEIFDVDPGTTYRFRVISAATLYPVRVFIEEHTNITLVASDGYELSPIPVESFIIQPGERYDFLLDTKVSPGKSSYLLIAESLEADISSRDEVHIAEAIIWYKHMPFTYVNNRPSGYPCSSSFKCRTFNCPFLLYNPSLNRECISYNEATSADPDFIVNDVKGNVKDLFFNFGFPGPETPGSVNGRQFISPTINALRQRDKISTTCGSNCGKDQICECTYSVDLNRNQIYQFVLSNVGNGGGFSHPIHLHGHSFYVLKYGFGNYSENGQILNDNQDIDCDDEKAYCNEEKWANAAWNNGNVPGINLDNPAQKDTVIVPTGGYVVIRFKADNPGVWFFHCHIDLHNTNGMGMVIFEEGYQDLTLPSNVLRCGTYAEAEDEEYRGGYYIATIVLGCISGLFLLIIIVFIVVNCL